MRVLCLVHDDKFIDDLVITYERLSIDAVFIALVNGTEDFKYIKKSSRVGQVVIGSTEYRQFVMCKGFDLVWVHYATEEKIRFVAACPKRVCVVWSTWGNDYCTLLHNYIFEPRTLLRWMLAHSIRECAGYLVRTVLSLLRIQNCFQKDYVKSFLRRVSFYSTVLPTEASFVKRLLQPSAQHIAFHYVGHSRYTLPAIQKKKFDYNVLVGNSATYSNNTFDALFKLSRIQDVSKVVCPLSYGDCVCRDQIDKYGRRLYKERWNPIFEFLPKNDYLRIVGNCDVFIFNHVRQQAIGNVNWALRLGGVVVLNEKSPAWRYYESIGVKIYSMRQLLLGIKQLVANHAQYKTKNVERLADARGYDILMSNMAQTFCFLGKYIEG